MKETEILRGLGAARTKRAATAAGNNFGTGWLGMETQKDKDLAMMQKHGMAPGQATDVRHVDKVAPAPAPAPAASAPAKPEGLSGAWSNITKYRAGNNFSNGFVGSSAQYGFRPDPAVEQAREQRASQFSPNVAARSAEDFAAKNKPNPFTNAHPDSIIGVDQVAAIDAANKNSMRSNVFGDGAKYAAAPAPVAAAAAAPSNAMPKASPDMGREGMSRPPVTTTPPAPLTPTAPLSGAQGGLGVSSAGAIAPFAATPTPSNPYVNGHPQQMGKGHAQAMTDGGTAAGLGPMNEIAPLRRSPDNSSSLGLETALRRGTAFLHGPGTGTSDSIPANLSRGEAVLPAKTVRKVGAHNIARLIQDTNDGKKPATGLRGRGKYADGAIDVGWPRRSAAPDTGAMVTGGMLGYQMKPPVAAPAPVPAPAEGTPGALSRTLKNAKTWLVGTPAAAGAASVPAASPLAGALDSPDIKATGPVPTWAQRAGEALRSSPALNKVVDKAVGTLKYAAPVAKGAVATVGPALDLHGMGYTSSDSPKMNFYNDPDVKPLSKLNQYVRDVGRFSVDQVGTGVGGAVGFVAGARVKSPVIGATVGAGAGHYTADNAYDSVVGNESDAFKQHQKNTPHKPSPEEAAIYKAHNKIMNGSYNGTEDGDSIPSHDLDAAKARATAAAQPAPTAAQTGDAGRDAWLRANVGDVAQGAPVQNFGRGAKEGEGITNQFKQISGEGYDARNGSKFFARRNANGTMEITGAGNPDNANRQAEEARGLAARQEFWARTQPELDRIAANEDRQRMEDRLEGASKPQTQSEAMMARTSPQSWAAVVANRVSGLNSAQSNANTAASNRNTAESNRNTAQYHRDSLGVQERGHQMTAAASMYGNDVTARNNMAQRQYENGNKNYDNNMKAVEDAFGPANTPNRLGGGTSPNAKHGDFMAAFNLTARKAGVDPRGFNTTTMGHVIRAYKQGVEQKSGNIHELMAKIFANPVVRSDDIFDNVRSSDGKVHRGVLGAYYRNALGNTAYIGDNMMSVNKDAIDIAGGN